MSFTVLLVCTGNTCRSAMAEGVLRSMIRQKHRDAVRVESAGTAGLEGAPATAHARDVCHEHGVDISDHESHALTQAVLTRADLVLAMAHGHVEQVTAMAPAAAGRTFLLSEFADGTDVDVPDPIGAPREDYELVFGMLEGYLAKSLPTILRLAGKEE